MKTCSKCKRELPLEMFWSMGGIPHRYPSCIDCQKNHRTKRIKSNPLCIKCKVNPHMEGDCYCYPCTRVRKRIGAPKNMRRTQETHLCPKCLKRERGDQPYCPPCKMEYQNSKRAKKWHDRYIGNEAKRIATARSYATGLLQRGKIKRGPCVFCGVPGTQFHHYDYERKTRNFEDVCYPCHLKVHAFLEIYLTIQKQVIRVR